MTIASTTRTINYTSTGVSGSFSFSYFIFLNTHLSVTVQAPSAGATYTLALSTDGTTNDYTVTGMGNSTGGSISLVARGQTWMSSSVLTAGWSITIARVVPLTQITNVRGEGPYNPEIHENEYDLLCMADQQIQAGLTPVQAVVNANGYLTLPLQTVDLTNPISGAVVYAISQGGKVYLKAVFPTGLPITLTHEV